MPTMKKLSLLLLVVFSFSAWAFADGPELTVSPDSLFFRQVGAVAPPAAKVAVGARGGTLGSFTAAASTKSGGNWLSVSPASGNGPGNITVSANTSGLTAGEYSGTVTITAPGFSNSPFKLKVSLEIHGTGDDGHGNSTGGPTSALIVRPDELEFSGVEGGPAPKSRQVEITNPAGANFNWTAAAQVVTPSGGKWLKVSPASGSGKGVLQVDVDPAGLAKGEYKGQIIVASGNSQTKVDVQLEMEAGRSARLVLDPRAFNFIVEPNATQPPAPKLLRVKNAGGGTLKWTAAAKVHSPDGGKWLSINPTSGTDAGEITVKVDPTGLAPGMYAGSITASAGTASAVPGSSGGNASAGPGSSGGNASAGPGSNKADDSAEAKVFLRVLAPAKPRVIVNPKTLKFTAVNGTASPASRAIKIESKTSGLNFTATAATAKGGNWLSITPASGSVPGAVTASVNAAGLSPGIYTGKIEIKAPGAAQEVQTVHVGLKVFRSGETPHLEVDPGGLAFAAVKGSSNPAPRKVALETEGAASIPWTASATTASGGNWLSATPASGTATAAGPNEVTISANISGLQEGAYAGTVVFTPAASSGASPVSLHVKLIVAAAAATPKDSPMVADLAAPALHALFNTPTDGFIAQAELPVSISTTVLDSNGVAVEGAIVVVHSSNSEPDLALDDLGGGLYAGVFRPLSSGPLTLSASAQTGIDASSTFMVSGDMEAASQAPSLVFQGGGVSAASFAASPTPLAPGSLMSLFGRGIAGPGGSASSVPLPASLSGVSVTIGGVPAPLIVAIPASSSNGYDQINLQVPFELAGIAQADVVVSNNGVIGVPETISVGAAPAVFTTSQNGDGAGAFLHADNSPVDANRAVAVGEVLQLYATGLGPVASAVDTGAASPGADPVLGNVTVTIGGQPASVRYAGLAPGFAGLYQINVVVPAGSAGDNVPVVVTVDGAPSTGRAVIPMIR